MKWASAVSEAAAFEDALEAVWEELDAVGPPSSWDLLFVFVSPHHAAFFESIPVSVLQHAPRAQLIGCTAGGVLSGGHELEQVQCVHLVNRWTLRMTQISQAACPRRCFGQPREKTQMRIRH